MSSTVPGVHRTGPLPAASDYSKTLLHALVAEDTDSTLPMGTVSKMQLLLMSLVERVHDAIYVLPRHARDTALGSAPVGPPPDPMEYAKDVSQALKQLRDLAVKLPDDSLTEEIFLQRLAQLNEELREVKSEAKQQLEKAKEVRGLIQERLASTYSTNSLDDNINTP